MRVLVTDADSRAALAVCRSLHRAGATVFACGRSRFGLAALSRAVRSWEAAPDPVADPQGFADRVRSVAVRRQVDCVLPVTDAANLALLARRGQLAPIDVLGPDAAAFALVLDKERLLRLAAEHGIYTPEQVVVRAADDRAQLDAVATAGFPVVVKPSRSVAGGQSHSVSYAADADALDRTLRRLPASAFPVLIQRRILGPGVGTFVLLLGSELRASFGHERILENPPSGGRSVICESRAPDPECLERTVALLRAIGWEGPAMAEYKRDLATGRDYLMEINGRFWGSLQLAVDAGVDFPSLWLDARRHAASPASPRLREGVRLVTWWGAVDTLLVQLRRSRAELNLPATAPRLPDAVRSLLVSLRRGRVEVLRLDDPLPALAEFFSWLRRRTV